MLHVDLVVTKKVEFGREGGSEGIRAYTKYELPVLNKPRNKTNKSIYKIKYIDKTPKLYIGGKQKDQIADIHFLFLITKINLFVMFQTLIEKM